MRRKCRSPASVSRGAPKPKPLNGAVPSAVNGGAMSPCSTRASSTLPPASALTAKRPNPLRGPLAGRLKIQIRIRRGAPLVPFPPADSCRKVTSAGRQAGVEHSRRMHHRGRASAPPKAAGRETLPTPIPCPKIHPIVQVLQPCLLGFATPSA